VTSEAQPPVKDEPSKKHLPTVEVVDAGESRRKAGAQTRAEEEAKAKLAELVDQEAYKRRERRSREQRERSDAAWAEEKRQWAEADVLCKKYPIQPYLSSADTQGPWLDKRFPLLWYYAYANKRDRAQSTGGGSAADAVSKARGKEWQEFCRLVGRNTDEGNQAKIMALGGLRSGGGRWIEQALKASGRASNLRGGDPEDSKRTWEELLGRVLRDNCAPGSGARDLTAYCIREALTSNPCNLQEGTWPVLLDGLDQLTKPDKEGAPLSRNQRAIILRQVLDQLANPRYHKPKDISPSFQVALIRELRNLDDIDSLPLYRKLQKESPFRAVREEASAAITDLGPLPRERWYLAIPDPRLTPESRAQVVKKALDGKLLRYDETNPSAPIVETIANAYKLPRGLTAIETKDDPGLVELKRALETEHVPVRLMASKVISESNLDGESPIRKKAEEVLVQAIFDYNVGPRTRLEAIALLDDALTGRQLIKLDSCVLRKEAGALIVEDKKGNRYTWTDDGKLERLDKDGTILEGDPTAKVTIEGDTVSIKYGALSSVRTRTGKFDGKHLKELRWTVTGNSGEVEFVARRKFVGGQYVDRWVITVPGGSSRLTADIEVTGKFALTKFGDCSYIGENWTTFGAGRILHQSQKLRGNGVRHYTE